MSKIELFSIGDKSVLVDETGTDWEPSPSTKYYAQILPCGPYAFGRTKDEAFEKLKKKVSSSPL